MNEIKAPNPCWVFQLDELNDWACCAAAFTKEECQKIIEIARDNPIAKATIESKDRLHELESIRNSYIAWIPPKSDNFWVFQRISSVIMDMNKKFFHFDLFGIVETLQFTEYRDDNGHYAKHVDKSCGLIPRKLSMSLQLTDPNDYDGGDLLLHLSDKPTVADRKQGSMTVFPSYTLHEVSPVTRGTRHSLVAWVTGKQFT